MNTKSTKRGHEGLAPGIPFEPLWVFLGDFVVSQRYDYEVNPMIKQGITVSETQQKKPKGLETTKATKDEHKEHKERARRIGAS